jgi:hypothetical protein
MKTFLHLWHYIAELFLEWQMLIDKSSRENQNTFCLIIVFQKIVPFVR